MCFVWLIFEFDWIGGYQKGLLRGKTSRILQIQVDMGSRRHKSSARNRNRARPAILFKGGEPAAASTFIVVLCCPAPKLHHASPWPTPPPRASPSIRPGHAPRAMHFVATWQPVGHCAGAPCRSRGARRPYSDGRAFRCRHGFMLGIHPNPCRPQLVSADTDADADAAQPEEPDRYHTAERTIRIFPCMPIISRACRT